MSVRRGLRCKNTKGGGNYREEVSFRLIDVWIDSWWLKWDNVVDIAKSLDIKTVPKLYTLEVGVRNQFREKDIVGIESSEDIKDLVIHQKSVVAFDEKEKEIDAEGIVARSHPLVLFRNGNPVVWKLKRKDF